MSETDFEKLVEQVKAYHPSPDLELLQRAYNFSSECHKTQIRVSGEPYFNHLFETAILVCKLRLDIPSVCAALLHDTIEDCNVTHEVINEKFGSDIADIVEGVTKLTRVVFESREEKQAESFRKMLLAMAKDIRVVLVKLCDRLHNMRTLQHLAEEKQRRVAIETQEIYAPLANRLGIHWVKSELEDLCLLSLRPEIYNRIKSNLAETKSERSKYIKDSKALILNHLEEAGISGTVSGRAKHFSSIWSKMESSKIRLDEVHDLHGFRISVPTLRACYETLGVVHAAWKPVPGRFKDYIAMPKPNGYQSLHTTVIGPDGQRIEIQIRTPEMHRVAEEGIAAHWKYKEQGSDPKYNNDSSSLNLRWVNELVEDQQYLKNPDEFIQSVKGELFPEDVFVFTPTGDLIRLPFNSTPVDFAYAIHTDVGHHTVGAKVNGSMVPIDKKLENGDTIEVTTSKTQVPSRDWLKFVCSSKAKQRIRAFVKSQEHARSMAIGMELLTKDLRKVQMSLKKLEKKGEIKKIALSMGLTTEGELYAQLGYGKINSATLLAKLLPDDDKIEEKLKREATPLERIFQRAARASRQKVGVTVSGMSDILVRFAKCCEPLPGDRITGFVSRGRGVTVHRGDCAQVLQSDPHRKIEVGWDTQVVAPRKVKLTIHTEDALGVLSGVTKAITDIGANIVSAQVKTTEGRKAVHFFELRIEDAAQLDKVIRAIERVPGIIKVERIKSMKASIDF